jgi:hypothetical protein
MTTTYIDGFDERYSISTDGTVFTKHDRPMKPQVGKHGYCRVELYKKEADGRMFAKKHLIHRLVAQAFIPNPNNYPEVNHKNSNKQDNLVENLEWVSHEQNQQRMKHFKTATGEHHISFARDGGYQGGFRKSGKDYRFHATTLEEAIVKRDELYKTLYPT